MYMWKIVLASEYTRVINIDMAPKPEIITSLELCRNSNAKFVIFEDDELDKGLAK